MNQPQEVLVRAASEVLGNRAIDLHSRGWPARVEVEYDVQRDVYMVSLVVELPWTGPKGDDA